MAAAVVAKAASTKHLILTAAPAKTEHCVDETAMKATSGSPYAFEYLPSSLPESITEGWLLSWVRNLWLVLQLHVMSELTCRSTSRSMAHGGDFAEAARNFTCWASSPHHFFWLTRTTCSEPGSDGCGTGTHIGKRISVTSVMVRPPSEETCRQR